MAFSSGSGGVGALVADVGAFSFRLGFAGDELPRCYRASLIGVATSSASTGAPGTGTTASPQPKHYFELSQSREEMKIESIVDGSGLIHDWKLLEKMLSFAQTHYMKLDFKDTPIILAEKPYNTPKLRHQMCELVFEKLGSPATFLSKDAVLACYACGKTSGLVIDIGASGTVVTPIQDGWAESRNSLRSIVGGRYMDNYLFHLLKKRRGAAPTPHFRLMRGLDPTGALVVAPRPNLGAIHPTFDALMNLELGRDCKETVCRMADSSLTEAAQRYSSIPTAPYELPDGTIVDMGIERYMVPELLCDSTAVASASQTILASGAPDDLDLLGLGKDSGNCSFESVPRIALEVAMRSEVDLQANLLANVVVTGGGASFDGLPERFKAEIEKLVHPLAPQTKVKVMAAGAGERAICAWLGGSILGSLGSFHEMWFTRAEYEEYGAQLVDRKCP